LPTSPESNSLQRFIVISIRPTVLSPNFIWHVTCRHHTFDVSSRAVRQARHSQIAWARHVRCVKPLELVVTSASRRACRASRARCVERVEQCCSTNSTQPKCMGSTRRTCRVVSKRYVTSQVSYTA